METRRVFFMRTSLSVALYIIIVLLFRYSEQSVPLPWFLLPTSGIVFVFLGGFLNFIVSFANDYKMPVMVRGERGRLNIAASVVHCEMTENTRFKWLGDRIYFFRSSWSIGDLLLFGGFFLLLFWTLAKSVRFYFL